VRKYRSGHSLLEAIIAAAVFVMVAVALSGVWVMYGRALAKSGENLAANHLARSVTEGLIANGYEWLRTLEGRDPLPHEDFTMKRRVRGRSADIFYNVTYQAVFNTGLDPSTRLLASFLSQDVCRLTVSVRWNSGSGDKLDDTAQFNNEIVYTSYVYKGAIN
jgi:hypothetical protein